MNQKKLIRSLIDEGAAHFRSPKKKINFETGIQDAEILLNNLKKYPHIFILACVMDRQFIAGKAWAIPYKVGLRIGGFEFKDFLKLNLQSTQKIFDGPQPLHRLKKIMAGNFYLTIKDIDKKYYGNASMLWSGNISSAAIIRKFLEFKGVGVKIATMATNILARDFKVSMKDLSSIDISPDVRVKRFFIENGLLRKEAKNEELIYLARELYPKYPGVFDLPAWSRDRKRHPSKIGEKEGIKHPNPHNILTHLRM